MWRRLRACALAAAAALLAAGVAVAAAQQAAHGGLHGAPLTPTDAAWARDPLCLAGIVACKQSCTDLRLKAALHATPTDEALVGRAWSVLVAVLACAAAAGALFGSRAAAHQKASSSRWAAREGELAARVRGVQAEAFDFGVRLQQQGAREAQLSEQLQEKQALVEQLQHALASLQQQLEQQPDDGGEGAAALKGHADAAVSVHVHAEAGAMQELLATATPLPPPLAGEASALSAAALEHLVAEAPQHGDVLLACSADQCSPAGAAGASAKAPLPATPPTAVASRAALEQLVSCALEQGATPHDLLQAVQARCAERSPGGASPAPAAGTSGQAEQAAAADCGSTLPAADAAEPAASLGTPPAAAASPAAGPQQPASPPAAAGSHAPSATPSGGRAVTHADLEELEHRCLSNVKAQVLEQRVAGLQERLLADSSQLASLSARKQRLESDIEHLEAMSARKSKLQSEVEELEREAQRRKAEVGALQAQHEHLAAASPAGAPPSPLLSACITTTRGGGLPSPFPSLAGGRGAFTPAAAGQAQQPGITPRGGGSSNPFRPSGADPAFSNSSFTAVPGLGAPSSAGSAKPSPSPLQGGGGAQAPGSVTPPVSVGSAASGASTRATGVGPLPMRSLDTPAASSVLEVLDKVAQATDQRAKQAREKREQTAQLLLKSPASSPPASQAGDAKAERQ